ncbi:metal ABC transporter solute-binding protein, Zn/Mn family [Desulfospira joergensenii]|uniref:metal ABC transporter solute-binding protein, Zn/Mn family n=1 Tax=Desulfospira joergensenii TaxID=53329 RepID=UPI0003B5A0C0|nr:zinc ABC transporter substrate-binding protein [Desulfospira joergensenii]
MNALIRFAAGLILILGLPGMGFAKSPLQVHVSILPQKYFVERIAGDLAQVDVLVKPGKSPATYSPSPDQIKKLAGSDVYFRIGVPFENGFLHKIEDIAGNILVKDTRQGIRLRDMEADHEGEEHEAEEDHDHGEEGHEHGEDHHHEGKDPHIWMSPVLVKKQADMIFQTLADLDPEHRDIYEKNHNAFSQDLDGLHQELTRVLAPMKGENLFVFHPAFGYFTDAYGLHQIAVENMGKSPKGKELSRIIKLARTEKARVIFVQPQFDRNAAQKIASAINGAVVSIDPLARDYLANMRKIGATVAAQIK